MTDREEKLRLAEALRERERRRTQAQGAAGPSAQAAQPQTPQTDFEQFQQMHQEKGGPADWLARTFVGERPPDSEDLPSFDATNATIPQQMRLAAGFLLNAKPEARKDMLREVLGDEVEFSQDSAGNELVTFGDETGFLNRPGFDMRDATQLAGEMLKFTPAAKFAQWVGKTAQAASKMFVPTRAAVAGGTTAAGTQAASDKASEAFGSQQGIDPVGTTIAGLGGAGGEFFLGRLRGFTPEAKQATSLADELGINLKAPPGQQVDEIATAARTRLPQERGEGFTAVATAARRARDTERAAADEQFTAARASNARVPQDEISGFATTARATLADDGFDAAGMPQIAKRLDELDELAKPGVPFSQNLRNMEQWRRRVTKMSPKDGSPEQAAATRLRQQYDEWIEGQFNRDMISGDAAAIQKWKDARGAWTSFKDRFDGNKFIRDITRNETTPEQMRQWLFNTSAVGAKKEAGLVVRKLKDILGKDHPSLEALRAEVYLDISEPLMRDVPNLRQFVRNYDRLINNNPTLRKELFPDGMGDFGELVKFSRGVMKRPGAVPNMREAQGAGGLYERLARAVSAYTVGHGIARGGVRTRTVQGLAGLLRQATVGPGVRRRLLEEYIGYNPKVQLMPGVGTQLGAAQSQIDLDQ